VRQLEETNRVDFTDRGVDYLPRDLQPAEIEATAASCLPDRVVETHLPLPPEDIAGLDPIVGHLIHDFLDLVIVTRESVAPTWTILPAFLP